jgi:hypothetical protein
MKPLTPITQSYSPEQYARDCVALRIELGLLSHRMTGEQQKIYEEAKKKLWQEKNNWQPPDNRRQTTAEQSEPQSEDGINEQ